MIAEINPPGGGIKIPGDIFFFRSLDLPPGGNPVRMLPCRKRDEGGYPFEGRGTPIATRRYVQLVGEIPPGGGDFP